MTERIHRKSDKYTWPLLIGFFGMFASTILLRVFLPDGDHQYTWMISIPLGLLALYVISVILSNIADKKDCKEGLHELDSWNVCRHCHKPQAGHEERIRNFEEAISQKHGLTKLFLPMIIITVIVIGAGYLIFTNEQHGVAESFSQMNYTSNACLNLVKAQQLEKNNWFVVSSEMNKAIESKWNQFDCVHQNIVDDLNHTCPMGVSPSLGAFPSVNFVCNNNQVREK